MFKTIVDTRTKENLSISDLRFLIGLYSKRKKEIEKNLYLTAEEKSFLITEYSKRIHELKRELMRKRTMEEGGVSELPGIGELQLLANDMLDRMGYSKNKLFKIELLVAPGGLKI